MEPLASCTPAGVRTLDPLIKSQMLYQLSYKRMQSAFLCTPAGVRTLDPLIKSQMLYQLSYKRMDDCSSLICGCKGSAFLCNSQIFSRLFC